MERLYVLAILMRYNFYTSEMCVFSNTSEDRHMNQKKWEVCNTSLCFIISHPDSIDNEKHLEIVDIEHQKTHMNL